MHTVQAYTRETQESRRYGAAVSRAFAVARKRIAMTGSLTAMVILLVFGAITQTLAESVTGQLFALAAGECHSSIGSTGAGEGAVAGA